MKAADLFDWPESLAPFAAHFDLNAAPWTWVSQIEAALAAFDFDSVPGRTDIPPGVHIEGAVYIDPTVKLPPYAFIKGPAWIGPGTEIRPGAFIRGKVIIGAGCVIGNSSEFKNSLLLDKVQAPHFNYVGDSVLGNGAHLGAGVICANLRLDQKPVPVTLADGSRASSGMRKLGALMGDAAEAGCNSVLQPGCVLGKRAVVISMPFAGYLPPNTIAYSKEKPALIKRR
ncbi:MAG: UDP-N-acetylglucosamine diphosphorylase [Bradymonadia bacterium]